MHMSKVRKVPNYALLPDFFQKDRFRKHSISRKILRVNFFGSDPDFFTPKRTNSKPENVHLFSSHVYENYLITKLLA